MILAFKSIYSLLIYKELIDFFYLHCLKPYYNQLLAIGAFVSLFLSPRSPFSFLMPSFSSPYFFSLLFQLVSIIFLQIHLHLQTEVFFPLFWCTCLLCPVFV